MPDNDWFWKLPRESQDEILFDLHEAMQWRGWAKRHSPTMTVSKVSEIADLLYKKHGVEIMEYT